MTTFRARDVCGTHFDCGWQTRRRSPEWQVSERGAHLECLLEGQVGRIDSLHSLFLTRTGLGIVFIDVGLGIPTLRIVEILTAESPTLLGIETDPHRNGPEFDDCQD